MVQKTGVLCHISSLAGKYGIGSLGKEAYRFARRLKKSGVGVWQILPICQTGFGDSPYQTVSAFSGNPYFIDLETLKKRKLLTEMELREVRKLYEKSTGADYAMLYQERFLTLRKAFSRFHFDSDEFSRFVESGTAEDYALFMTAKTIYGGGFCDWEAGLMRHERESLKKLKESYHEEYLFWQFLQFEFFREWKALKRYCNRLGIELMGDLPLYVSSDSADVWAHRELFKLNEDLTPKSVAGVPPDYFSENGQVWGNPVYDWAAHEKEGFAWWKERFAFAFEMYDLVRFDHFRGVYRYFEIEAGSRTAKEGHFEEGPKDKLFEGLSGGEKKRLIAEDLGMYEEGVKELMERLGICGMKVLLFAFDGNEDNAYLPHNFGRDCILYTGTHDNDTVAGYVKSLSSEEFILLRSRVASELKRMEVYEKLSEDPSSFSRAFVDLALASKAKLVILPVQDLLGLDNSCRMNLPGTKAGNWKFRLKRLPSAPFCRLNKSIKKYRR